MTEEQAAGLVGELESAYPRTRLLAPSRDRFTHALRSYSPAAGALAIQRLTNTMTGFPSVAELRRLCDSVALEQATGTGISPRLHQIAAWRAMLENPHIAADVKARVAEDAGDCCPGITEREWDDARRLQDERYARTQADREAKRLKPLPPRFAATWPRPPGMTYDPQTGPKPGDMAYRPPRGSDRAKELTAALSKSVEALVAKAQLRR